MAIKIVLRKPQKPVQADPDFQGATARKEIARAVPDLPKASGKVVPRCKYCGHEYLEGGCSFERQKTCGNHPPGKKRVIATKSLD